ncbi:hypothetical protein [Ectopseudomonas oleovorans]|uniref:hypothetical protein n=1 Tax=Ectopseudomonas oleovorans TaxID=301 RepID=UPI00241FC8D8|nr:hypothetical protein [Pseudomonas oleovorans]
MNNHFSLITSQDDPTDTQLAELMNQVRKTAHRRVERVDNQLNRALIQAIRAKKENSAARANRDA